MSEYSSEKFLKTGTGGLTFIGPEKIIFEKQLATEKSKHPANGGKQELGLYSSGGTAGGTIIKSASNKVIPLFPPGASLDQNISDTEKEGLQGFFRWYNRVRNNGPWDYKQLDRRYEDAGNFNYGATGAALGLPDHIILRAAGWAAKQSGTSPEGSGHYLLSPPYGDDPTDQEAIKKGIDHYRSVYGN